MALNATTILEVRSDGHDDNGGGFDSSAAGTDRSQQASPHVTIDGATITATVHTTTTQLNITGYTVSSADIGNVVNINGGTATNKARYRITAVDVPNNRWTVDASVGTAAQTATGRMGGALATPGLAASLATISLMIVWIKSGNYTLTTTTPGASGPLAFGATLNLRIEGYDSSRGDRGTKPVISAGSQTNVTIISSASSSAANTLCLINLKVDGNGGTGVNGINLNVLANTAIECEAINCDGSTTNYGFTNGKCYGCLADGNGIGFSAVGLCVDCTMQNSSSDGYNGTGTLVLCVARDNAGKGINFTGASSVAYACTCADNTGDGIGGNGNNSLAALCAATANGAYGVNLTGASARSFRTATHGNVSGGITAVDHDISPITMTGDPWTAANDFRADNTANEGALLRVGVGPPSQTNNRDIGAVQHADPAGGSAGARLVGPSALVG